METILEISKLTKMYKNGRGVKRVSFSMEKGDIVGLLGPNGSGKTTTMKVILGLCHADEGNIKVFGMDLNEHFEEIMDRIGCLVEAPSIYTDLTAVQNLKMMAKYYPKVTDEHIDKALEIVRLSQYKKDKAGKFSLGMKQRLGLAMAWLAEPELVILDEPVNGLDIEGMIEVREIIGQMAKKYETSFLISSHLSVEIEKTCNKVGVMYEGELVSFTTLEKAMEFHPTLEDYFLATVKEKRGNIVL